MWQELGTLGPLEPSTHADGFKLHLRTSKFDAARGESFPSRAWTACEWQEELGEMLSSPSQCLPWEPPQLTGQS